MYRYWMIILGVVLCSICSSAQNKWSYIDLIEQLTDLERLAVLPDKWERCAQWSSYDRASRYDEVTDQYVNWSSNRDNLGLLNRKDDIWQLPAILTERMNHLLVPRLYMNLLRDIIAIFLFRFRNHAGLLRIESGMEAREDFIISRTQLIP